MSIVKEFELLVCTKSIDYEGILEMNVYVALQDFDARALWKAYRTVEEAQKRAGTWQYDTDFFMSLEKDGMIKAVGYTHMDTLMSTKKPIFSIGRTPDNGK